MPKELLVSDESYNSYNIRVLTSGGDFSRFNNNPIMLLNHNRISGSQDGLLPIGTWKLRVAEDKIFGTPEFDMEDEFAAKIAGKYERGIIRSASLGLRVVDMQEDGPDQQGNMRYTITKWQLQEISLVDIPSNENAVAVYGEDDEQLELSDIIELAAKNTKAKIDVPMKYQEVPTLLGLSADASGEAVTKEVKQLLQLKAEHATLKSENERLKQEERDRREAEIVAFVDQAEKDKKIAKEDKPRYIKLAQADFETTKQIIENLAPVVNLSDIPNGTAGKGMGNDGKFKYEGKTFSELQKEDSDKLAQLKVNDFDTFNELYKSEFGKDYKV